MDFMTRQIKIRPHNDDPSLVVIELRTYDGNAEDSGTLIDDEIITPDELMRMHQPFLKSWFSLTAKK